MSECHPELAHLLRAQAVLMKRTRGGVKLSAERMGDSCCQNVLGCTRAPTKRFASTSSRLLVADSHGSSRVCVSDWRPDDNGFLDERQDTSLLFKTVIYSVTQDSRLFRDLKTLCDSTA
jgi:hypothetical protein